MSLKDIPVLVRWVFGALVAIALLCAIFDKPAHAQTGAWGRGVGLSAPDTTVMRKSGTITTNTILIGVSPDSVKSSTWLIGTDTLYIPNQVIFFKSGSGLANIFAKGISSNSTVQTDVINPFSGTTITVNSTGGTTNIAGTVKVDTINRHTTNATLVINDQNMARTSTNTVGIRLSRGRYTGFTTGNDTVIAVSVYPSFYSSNPAGTAPISGALFRGFRICDTLNYGDSMLTSNHTDFLINSIETSLGRSGTNGTATATGRLTHNLADFQVGGVSQFKVGSTITTIVGQIAGQGGYNINGGSCLIGTAYSSAQIARIQSQISGSFAANGGAVTQTGVAITSTFNCLNTAPNTGQLLQPIITKIAAEYVGVNSTVTSIDSLGDQKWTAIRSQWVTPRVAGSGVVRLFQGGTNSTPEKFFVDTNGVSKHAVLTVAGLPTAFATYKGAIATVTDADVTTYGTIPVHTVGTNTVFVWCDGTNWYIH